MASDSPQASPKGHKWRRQLQTPSFDLPLRQPASSELSIASLHLRPGKTGGGTRRRPGMGVDRTQNLSELRRVVKELRLSPEVAFNKSPLTASLAGRMKYFAFLLNGASEWMAIKYNVANGLLEILIDRYRHRKKDKS